MEFNSFQIEKLPEMIGVVRCDPLRENNILQA